MLRLIKPAVSVIGRTSNVTKRSFINFVQPNHTAVISRFGKVSRVRGSGLSFYVPLLEDVTMVSNRVHSTNYDISVKTKDDVTTTLTISVLLHVPTDQSVNALISLSNSDKTFSNKIHDIIRSIAQSKTLDELYMSKNEIKALCSHDFKPFCEEYGRHMDDVQIVHINPDSKVTHAMNEINAAKRLSEAARFKAEADYIGRVRDAQAEAESNRLRGEGIANQRDAILSGLQKSVESLRKATDIDSDKIMNYIIEIQRIDAGRDIGTSQSPNKVIMMPFDYNTKGFHNIVSGIETAK